MSLDDSDNKDYIMNLTDYMKENTVIDSFEEKMRERKNKNKNAVTLEKFME